MKLIPALLAILSICPGGIFAAQDTAPDTQTPLENAPAAVMPADAAKAPWLNEKLEFRVTWGMIAVGTAYLSYEGLVTVSSEPCHHLISTAVSNSFIDTFFKVRDRNDSWLDAKTLASRGYSRKIKEGSYFFDEFVLFDYVAGKFFSTEKNNKGETIRKTGDIPKTVLDILGATYYVRSQKLEVGKDILLDVNTTKNWPLAVKVLKKDKIWVRAGKFPCVVVEPVMREQGIFVQKGKSMKIWLSDDENHYPLLMQAEVAIGKVSAELVKITR